MKKLLLTFAIGFCAAAASAQSISQDDFTFSTQGSEATLTGWNRTEGFAVVPATVEIDGKTFTVTAIDSAAFAGSQLSAISLPEGITKIATGAFSGCSHLTYVKLPSTLTSIGENAFQGCSVMGHINLPEGLQELGTGALRECSGLYTVEAEQLTVLGTLGQGALQGCEGLLRFPLPANMTEVPDSFMYGCQSIQEVKLPASLQRIGASAFETTGLTQIDLSQFNGEIGPRAFNDCESLQSLSLPASNSYCHVSADGKVLYDSKGQLLSVLPSVETLVVPYPNTGYYVADSTATNIFPLNGPLYQKLTKLELPCTWTAQLSTVMPSLQELIVRAPQPFIFSATVPTDAKLYVFDYALATFQQAQSRTNYGYTWSQMQGAQTLNLPSEQMYMQEELPRHEGMVSQNENIAYVWNHDWNSDLEENFPDYFRSEDPISEKNTLNCKIGFRTEMVKRYMTSERFQTYGSKSDTTIKCLDGQVICTSDFSVNDYVYWYMNGDTIYANDYFGDPKTTQAIPYEAPADWGIAGNRYWLLDNGTSTPQLSFALRMYPSQLYDIYGIFAPRHPLTTEENPCKNKVLFTLTYNADKLSTKRSDMLDLNYDGTPQVHLLFEDVEVMGDNGNSIAINSRASSKDVKTSGYVHTIPFVGVLCVAKKPFPLTDVSSPETVGAIRNIYDLQGRKLTKPTRGINIIQTTDGRTRRVVVK